MSYIYFQHDFQTNSYKSKKWNGEGEDQVELQTQLMKNTLKTMHFALSVIRQGMFIPELATGSKMCSAPPRTFYSL